MGGDVLHVFFIYYKIVLLEKQKKGSDTLQTMLYF